MESDPSYANQFLKADADMFYAVAILACKELAGANWFDLLTTYQDEVLELDWCGGPTPLKEKYKKMIDGAE